MKDPHWYYQRVLKRLDGYAKTYDDQASNIMTQAADSIEFLLAENARLKSVIKDADEYLDINEMTTIGHDSILHKEFKVINRVKE